MLEQLYCCVCTIVKCLKRKSPLWVENVVIYLLFGQRTSWWYAFLRSNFVKYFALFNSMLTSSAVDIKWRTCCMALFGALMSIHNLICLLFFGTTTTRLTHGVPSSDVTGSIISSSCNLTRSFSISSFSHMKWDSPEVVSLV